jgi:hypothetical protein
VAYHSLALTGVSWNTSSRKGSWPRRSHKLLVHADEVSGLRVARKLLLDHNCLTDDQGDTLVRALGVQQVEEAGNVAVKTLIACNELVGESEARHETTLLEP